MCKSNGMTLFISHEYEGAVRAFADQNESRLVRVQGICLSNESRFVTIQGCRTVDLVQPRTLRRVQGPGHLWDGLIRLITQDMHVRTEARGYQMWDMQSV